MKILTTEQLRALDQYTIVYEPILSIDLMERAAKTCAEWIVKQCDLTHTFHIFCGKGNNGSDGLAIARLLSVEGCKIQIYTIDGDDNNLPSPNFSVNQSRLAPLGIPLHTIDTLDDFPLLNVHQSTILDALLGLGLNRPVQGLMGDVIQKINHSKCPIIAIDIPSGLFAENNSANSSEHIVQATNTLSFELPKLSFLFPENERYVGHWHILPIGLDKTFIERQYTPYHRLEMDDIRTLHKNRSAFSYKYNFGHSLILAGSKGKLGSAMLSAKACLRTGSGLVSVSIPSCGYLALQTALPEVMVETNEGVDSLQGSLPITTHKVIAIGPGIGTSKETTQFLSALLQQVSSPIVFDADALNILAKNPALYEHIPKNSILTPHAREFERLIGESITNEKNRLEKLSSFSQQHQCYVVLKGAYTIIACPDGQFFFNSTGNPGMATAGSGDVLTGIITGLLAQGYSSLESCLVGVFIHGLAGDLYIQQAAEETLIASDLIDYLGKAFRRILTPSL